MTSILAALSIVSLFALSLQFFLLCRKCRAPLGRAVRTPPISVLKPLRGHDEGLYENLTAISRQDYPDFEVILGAEDPLDPALEVARRVQRENPEVRIRVVTGSRLRGLNPKVRVLSTILDAAKHEWILVSDSNVRPDPGYLTAMWSTAESQGGRLVHNLLMGARVRSLGARFENLHMNGWVAGAIAICDAFGHPIVIGKSMLMTRSDLAAVGGLESVADVLAEDYVLGAAFRERGWPVVLSPYRLEVVSGARDFGAFLNRYVRWGQLRRHIAPHYFLAEPIANPTPFLLGWLLSVLGEPATFALTSPALPFGLLLVRWVIEASSIRRFSPDTDVKTLLLMPVKDLIVPLMWLASALRTRVSWRGHHMRIGSGSRLRPLEQELVTEASRA